MFLPGSVIAAKCSCGQGIPRPWVSWSQNDARKLRVSVVVPDLVEMR